MRVPQRHFRTVWLHPDDPKIVQIIDQRQLPFAFEVEDLRHVDAMAAAIRDMHVRGAGLIGAAAGYGMYLAALSLAGKGEREFAEGTEAAGKRLMATRPTAEAIADEDAEFCRQIGEHGLGVIAEIHRRAEQTVNILTHCNAGWLAFVDFGTATAPIYAAVTPARLITGLVTERGICAANEAGILGLFPEQRKRAG